MRPMRIGCDVVAEELTTVRALRAGTTGTKALAPANRLKKASEVFIMHEFCCRIWCGAWVKQKGENSDFCPH